MKDDNEAAREFSDKKLNVDLKTLLTRIETQGISAIESSILEYALKSKHFKQDEIDVAQRKYEASQKQAQENYKGMLTGNQEIIYRKNDSEISRLTADNWTEMLDATIAGYIRYYQPFTKKGNGLIIPRGGGRNTQTSTIERVERRENVLLVQTRNSVYEVEYMGIDLEKVLEDGEFKGVNADPGDRLAEFPGED